MKARIVALHVRPAREAAPQQRESVSARSGGGIGAVCTVVEAVGAAAVGDPVEVLARALA